jgi:periplasmic iron binding protein
MRSTKKAAILAGFALVLAASVPAPAAEFYIGEPVLKNGMLIQPNYLTGIEMEPMPSHSTMGPKTIHLEADIHAAAGETHGFEEGDWVPYVSVSYTIAKVDSPFRATGTLVAMTAKDGPHYANNLELAGPGQYRLTYHFEPPSKAGFVRHIDKETGVPDWWEPFDLEWTFTYPSREK